MAKALRAALNKRSQFDVSKLLSHTSHSTTLMAAQNKLKSMMSLNEVVTISVLKVKTCHRHSQLSNVYLTFNLRNQIVLASEISRTKLHGSHFDHKNYIPQKFVHMYVHIQYVHTT